MPSAKASKDDPALDEMGEEQEEDRPLRPLGVRQNRRRTKTRSSNQVLALILVGAGCLLVLVVAGIALVQFLKGRAKEAEQVVSARTVVQQPSGEVRPAVEERASRKDTGPLSKPVTESLQLPIWKTEPALLMELGPEVAVDKYSVRPPRGYERVTPPAGTVPPVGQFFFWASEPREDGTAASLTMMIVTPPGNEEFPSLEDAHEQSLESIKRRRQTWMVTRREAGLVGGIRFLRSRWNGMDADLGPMHGFSYSAFDGRAFISIASQDIRQHHQQALKIAEAAALTFRKP
ncbi:MAG TPA: hypothetical protein VGY66_17005 [Gemmataceae bacterium]|nr:hypothetical protein [Gemmataceae bacterium]